MAAANLVWPFKILDFERAALGALQGATTSTSEQGKEKGWMKYASLAFDLLGLAPMFL